MSAAVMGIIPARSGSKSIVDKNLALLCGYPLLAYSIAAARLSHRIDRVLLSTDSDAYAEIGERYGAEAPYRRPAEYSTDKSTDIEFMRHAMEFVRDREGDLPEYWVHLRPTTPLRDPEKIDAAVGMIEGKPEATALRSAHESPESPFKWFRRNEAGYLTGLTSDDTQLDRFNLPRQRYPVVYIPDGYVDIVRSSFVLDSGALHGNKVLAFESPYCTEVDSTGELELLEFQIRKHGSLLLDWLKLQGNS